MWIAAVDTLLTDDVFSILVGKHLGLRLSFTLPSSTYATMLIRELTKMPTDVAYAKALQHPV